MLFMAHYNRLISEELKYNPNELREQHNKLYDTLTGEQKNIYHTLMDVVDGQK